MMKVGGTPAEQPKIYERADVLAQIEKIRTPLLVMHGENDPQVPPANSAEFVKALREHHKTAFYFTHANELHGFTQPAHRLDVWQKQLAFLEHDVKPRYGTSSTSVEEIDFPASGRGATHTTSSERTSAGGRPARARQRHRPQPT